MCSFVINDWFLVYIICSISPCAMKNSFLYVHNTSVLLNTCSVSTLFKASVWAENFATRKGKCYSKISTFWNYNRNLESHYVTIHRISSSYLQITTSKFHLDQLNGTDVRNADVCSIFFFIIIILRPPCIYMWI